MDQKWPCRAHCSENRIWNDKNRNISGKCRGSCRSVFRRCKRKTPPSLNSGGSFFALPNMTFYWPVIFMEISRKTLRAALAIYFFRSFRLCFVQFPMLNHRSQLSRLEIKNKKTRFLYKVTFITAQYKISLRVFAGYSGIGILFSFSLGFHLNSQNHSNHLQ